MADRRQFLGNLVKAISGGLLLPIGGSGALALTDMQQAAKVPVAPTALPFSREALQLREIRRALHKVHLADCSPARQTEWQALMRRDYRPLAHKVATRSAEPTWATCVELAEIIWDSLDKEWDRTTGKTGRLSVSDRWGSGAYWCREEIVALVEAVLTLGKGERFDPSTEQGLFPHAVRPNGGHHHA